MSLATTGTPLKLADGRLVYPGGNIVDPNEQAAAPEFVEVPTNREARDLVVNARKKLSDLPEVPRTMNAVSVVLSYTMFGLDETEIALATGMTEAQVLRVRDLEAYSLMKTAMIQQIMEAEADNVRSLFAQHSQMAVKTMIGVLSSSRVEANKIAVAKDILDRGGYRPTDVVEHRHKMDGGLTIEIIRKDDRAAPIIEVGVDE